LNGSIDHAPSLSKQPPHRLEASPSYPARKSINGLVRDGKGSVMSLSEGPEIAPEIVAGAAEPTMPLLPGARHRTVVADLAFGGEGVVRLGGFVVFVPFVLPGEEIEIELTEVKKQFGRGRCLRILRPAPNRVTPGCRHFGVCGGCQYQHLEYRAQLEIKRRQVAEILRRIGGVQADVVQPVVACPQPYGYRNRLMVRSQWNKLEERLLIGFLRQDSRLLVEVEECAIAEPGINAQLQGVRAAPPPRGGLKVVLRTLPEGWEVPRDSFFQNNRFLLPGLVAAVRDRLKAGGAQYLIDVYCGVGFFGIELASAITAFVGVECDVQAIRAARRNATAHGVTNGEFVAGDADACLPDLLERFPSEQTAVLLDPPRVGCRPASVARLLEVRPRQVVYVSCHPATLARDLNALCASGVYEVVHVTPLDMFPQTQHVECVADVRLTGSM
jgi:tRNA/tmRNA/rRNA uracil-C5-methylase (TrmA/RlmC/RlmD family)